MVALRSSFILGFALASLGCESVSGPQVDDPLMPPQFSALGPPIHHVSVGGADICEALGLPTGCDANASMVANQRADGSVQGQWHDVLGATASFGLVPLNITLDCLHVAGNEAWVSGVIRGGPFGGAPVIQKVVDNGTTSNDPPDQLSFMFLDSFGGCQAAPDFPLFDLTHGQATVW